MLTSILLSLFATTMLVFPIESAPPKDSVAATMPPANATGVAHKFSEDTVAVASPAATFEQTEAKKDAGWEKTRRSKSKSAAASTTSRISAKKALKIARKASTSKGHAEIELDWERGSLVYDVDIDTRAGEWTVHVDPTTGKVLYKHFERDYDDDFDDWDEWDYEDRYDDYDDDRWDD